jgi:hypothetical protein
VGEGGTIATNSYYFRDSLINLLKDSLRRREEEGGPLKFLDPTTRKKIVDVKWYKAHLVPEGTLGGRKKTRKSKKSKRKTLRKKRKQSNKKRKY